MASPDGSTATTARPATAKAVRKATTASPLPRPRTVPYPQRVRTARGPKVLTVPVRTATATKARTAIARTARPPRRSLSPRNPK